ncbi:MAG TPA: hypothetical protein VFS40_00555 [Gemmatimonadales bacterium]|nr:hypothetical protein [Gemmatimonadales bacterium]
MRDAEQVPVRPKVREWSWWAPQVDRALEDRALKRALERARGRDASPPASAWSVEELRSGLVVAPDGTIERLGVPGVPLDEREVAEALERYAALNRVLAERLQRAGLAEADIRRGLVPAETYRLQVDELRRYHAAMVGAEG